MQEQETILRLARLLYDRKASDIVVLNVSHLTVLCDHMVIASGRTDNQVSSLADAVDEMMAKEGVILRRSEGRREGAGSFLITVMLLFIFSTETNGPFTVLTASGMTEQTRWLSPLTRQYRTEQPIQNNAAAVAAAFRYALRARIRSRITSASCRLVCSG